MAIKEDVWPDGTVIKPGAWATYSPYLMGTFNDESSVNWNVGTVFLLWDIHLLYQGRSKKLWGNDAEEFKPERWSNTP